MYLYEKLNERLPDIQNTTKGFIKKPIYKVGIRKYRLPLELICPTMQGSFRTTAEVSAYASLSKESRGTNMSRFSEAINRFTNRGVNVADLYDVLSSLRDRLEAEACYVRFKFDYLMEVFAPESKLPSWFYIPVIIEGSLEGERVRRLLTTTIYYTSLCPCSKEISEYGAHNQRSTCTITVELPKNGFIYFESFKDLVDAASSCPIYNTLKRVDEKYVTEKSYDNPNFVEDTARKVSKSLDTWIESDKILDYVIVSENEESIHQSNACCIIHANKELR